MSNGGDTCESDNLSDLHRLGAVENDSRSLQVWADDFFKGIFFVEHLYKRKKRELQHCRIGGLVDTAVLFGKV